MNILELCLFKTPSLPKIIAYVFTQILKHVTLVCVLSLIYCQREREKEWERQWMGESAQTSWTIQHFLHRPVL